MSDDISHRCEALTEELRHALNQGRTAEALELAATAVRITRGCGDEDLEARAYCNWAAVSIEHGPSDGVRRELQRILLRSAHPRTRFLAAYSLARAYELLPNPEKALFYAQIANRHAHESGEATLRSSSHTLLAGLLLARSEFAAAKAELSRALELLPDETLNLRRAFVLDNLGYCYVVQGHYRRGFTALFESLRICRRLGARRYEVDARLSLAFAYLQLGRLRATTRHARTSLAICEETGDRPNTKHALFLLGEAEKLSGNPLAARHYFLRLQQEYYPEAPQVPDLLLFLDVQQLINLKG